MQGKVIIGTTDISNYVVEGTYKMDSADAYESWRDGNYVEHRIIVGSKVSGEFDVVLSSKNNYTLAQFHTMVKAAETNGIIPMAVYLTNTGVVKAINAFYTLSSQEHILQPDGSFIDIVTVGVQER